MAKTFLDTGIWIFYDGKCPVCCSVVHVIQIRKLYGVVHVIDARASINDAIVREISLLGYDLDLGMLIYENGRFHHGKDAITFLARYGEAENSLLDMCKSIFLSRRIATLLYPLMRFGRNILLRLRGIKKINNLGNHHAG